MEKRKPSVYSVAQVNSYIKNMFEQDFLLSSVYIQGEVSNCKYHSSGHIYFTLKDSAGVLNCVMFASSRSGLAFPLQEGQQVVVGGSVAVYERDGKYQLYAKTIRLDGIGLLYERYEALKLELEEMGMFAAEYKKPIPAYASRIGIITAKTGAAVRDVIQIAQRRNPYVNLLLYPAIVQGEQAARSIVAGIQAMEVAKVDLIIVGRGGGSLEDLWAFNERMVAQAIFDCTIPVISAVGHETDVTIADFVADLRAPTPSAAAEMAVFSYEAYQEELHGYQQYLKKMLMQQIERQRNRLAHYILKLQYLSPNQQIREKRTYAMDLENRLMEAMQDKLRKQKQRMELYIVKLQGLSPLYKLQQGFSFVTNEVGKNISDVDLIKEKDILTIHMTNGVVKTKVVTVDRNRRITDA